MNSISRNDILAGLVLTGFVGTIIYAIDVTRKLQSVSEKLDKSVKELVSSTDIDIPQELITKTVERAVKEEAKYQVEKAANKAASDIVASYKSEIRNVVEDEFDNQKDEVAKSLKRKIADIDIRELKREVVREAKADCANKLKKDLEEISDKYTDQIDSMTSIYSTIASKIEAIGD